MAAPLRVALDMSLLGRPAPTGVERAFTTLVDALARHADGHEFVHVRPGPALPLALWRETTLPRALRQQRIDVFHSPVAAVPLRAGCAVTATLHELPWAAARTGAPALDGGDRRLAHRARLALAARVATRLVCVSERTRAQFAKLHPEAAGRAVVIHHGVDPRFVPAGPASPEAHEDVRLRQRWHLEAQSYVLAVGRLRRKKNLAALLSAFAAATVSSPGLATTSVGSSAAAPLRLVLAGPDGDAAADLRARAAAPDLAGRVVFAGHVDDAALLALYRGAACVAFPSLLEGFGLPVLEAMACGVPVLASREGAAAEVCGQAVQACSAAEPASIARALAELLALPALRADLVTLGLAQAARFGSERMARAYVALFEDAAAGARHAPTGRPA